MRSEIEILIEIVLRTRPNETRKEKEGTTSSKKEKGRATYTPRAASPVDVPREIGLLHCKSRKSRPAYTEILWCKIRKDV